MIEFDLLENSSIILFLALRHGLTVSLATLSENHIEMYLAFDLLPLSNALHSGLML